MSAIDQALVQQANDGYTPLHNAARSQSDKSFTVLINKARSGALSAALVKKTNNNQTASDICIKEHSWNITLLLINKILSEALEQAISEENTIYVLKALFTRLHEEPQIEAFPWVRIKIINAMAPFKRGWQSLVIEKFIHQAKPLNLDGGLLALL